MPFIYKDLQNIYFKSIESRYTLFMVTIAVTFLAPQK